MGLAVAAPNTDKTLYEIYLDYRTAAAGLSARSALAATAQYASEQLGKAFAVGYATDSGRWYVSSVLSPGVKYWLSEEIGPIGTVIVSWVEQGTPLSVVPPTIPTTLNVSDSQGSYIGVSDGGASMAAGGVFEPGGNK